MSLTGNPVVGKRGRNKRSGLFLGYWFSLDGKRIRRVSRADLAEAYRLCSKHADVRKPGIPQ